MAGQPYTTRNSPLLPCPHHTGDTPYLQNVLPNVSFPPNTRPSGPNTSQSGMCVLSSPQPFPGPYRLIINHNSLCVAGTTLGAAPSSLRNFTKESLFSQGVLKATAGCSLGEISNNPKAGREGSKPRGGLPQKEAPRRKRASAQSHLESPPGS